MTRRGIGLRRGTIARFAHGRDDVGGKHHSGRCLAAHQLANVGVAVGMSFPQQADGGTKLAGSAIAALKRVVLDERRLQRVGIGRPASVPRPW